MYESAPRDFGTLPGDCLDCGTRGYAHRTLVCGAKREAAIKDMGELIRAYDERARYAHTLAFNIETRDHHSMESFRFDTCAAGGCVGAKAVLERMRVKYRHLLGCHTEPAPCATCRGGGFTCSCGDPDHIPCQASHRVVVCPECAPPDPRDRVAWLLAEIERRGY